MCLIKLYFGTVQLSIVSRTEWFERLCINLIKLRWWATGLFCLGRICFPGLIYCDQEPLWLLNVIKDDCYFLGVLYGYQLDVRCFTLKSLSLSLKSHMNVPLS